MQIAAIWFSNSVALLLCWGMLGRRRGSTWWLSSRWNTIFSKKSGVLRQEDARKTRRAFTDVVSGYRSENLWSRQLLQATFCRLYAAFAATSPPAAGALYGTAGFGTWTTVSVVRVREKPSLALICLHWFRSSLHFLTVNSLYYTHINVTN